jgi:hypothetical protein
MVPDWRDPSVVRTIVQNNPSLDLIEAKSMFQPTVEIKR